MYSSIQTKTKERSNSDSLLIYTLWYESSNDFGKIFVTKKAVSLEPFLSWIYSSKNQLLYTANQNKTSKFCQPTVRIQQNIFEKKNFRSL